MAAVLDNSLENTIQCEIQRVQDDLKGVDEKMRRLSGWDSFSDNRPRERRQRVSSFNRDDEPPAKRRSFGGVFARLGGAVLGGERRDAHRGSEEDWGGPKGPPRGEVRIRRSVEGPRSIIDEDDGTPKPSIASSVIRAVVDTKSRTEAAAEQTKDRASRDRNRRMFGALIGTLQRFKTDEAKQKDKDDQRAAIDKKLEEKGKAEQEEIRRKRQQLANMKKKKQAQFHKLNIQMAMAKEHESWVDYQNQLSNFISTKTSPQIFWLPKIHNSKSLRMVSATKEAIQEKIEQKNQSLKDELEELMGHSLEEGELDDLNAKGNFGGRDHKKSMVRSEDVDNGRDILDYEPEEGELVYDNDDLIVQAGKNDSSGRRMVVQVASGGGGGGSRRVELVTDQGAKKGRTWGLTNDSEKENIRSKVGRIMSEVDARQREKDSKKDKIKHKKEEKKKHKDNKSKHRKKSENLDSSREEREEKKQKGLFNGNNSRKVSEVQEDEDDLMDDLPPLPRDTVLDFGTSDSEAEEHDSQQSSNPVIHDNTNISVTIKQEKQDKDAQKGNITIEKSVVNKDIKQEKEIGTSRKANENMDDSLSINNDDLNDTPTRIESTTTESENVPRTDSSTNIEETKIAKPRTRARWDVKEKMVVIEAVTPEPVAKKANKDNENLIQKSDDKKSKKLDGKNDEKKSKKSDENREGKKSKRSDEKKSVVPNEVNIEESAAESDKAMKRDEKKKQTAKGFKKSVSENVSHSPENENIDSGKKSEDSYAVESDSKKKKNDSKKRLNSSEKKTKNPDKKIKQQRHGKKRKQNESSDDAENSSCDNESVASHSSSGRSSSSSGSESSSATSGTSDTDSDSSSTSGTSYASNSNSRRGSKSKKQRSSSNRNKQHGKTNKSGSDSEVEERNLKRKSNNSNEKRRSKSNSRDQSKKDKHVEKIKEDRQKTDRPRYQTSRDDGKKRREGIHSSKPSHSRSRSRDRKRGSDRKSKR